MAARKNAKAQKADPASVAGEGKNTGDSVDTDQALSFEVALERLEGLVDRLEDGDLELEESLGVFEQGVALSKHCADKLVSAERKVEQLVREGGELLTRPFEDVAGDSLGDGRGDGLEEHEGDYEER